MSRPRRVGLLEAAREVAREAAREAERQAVHEAAREAAHGLTCTLMLCDLRS
jgi:hypothetical protein